MVFDLRPLSQTISTPSTRYSCVTVLCSTVCSRKPQTTGKHLLHSESDWDVFNFSLNSLNRGLRQQSSYQASQGMS